MTRLLIVSILGTTALAACRAQVPYEKPPVPVAVRAVAERASGGQVRYSASISPNEQLGLAFRVGGYVRAVHRVRGAEGRMRPVQAGDRVRKGTVLARLRERDYAVKVAQARSRLEEARAQGKRAEAALLQANATPDLARFRVDEANAALNKAQQDHLRVERLVRSRTLSPAEFDATRARLSMAAAAADSAKAQAAVAPGGVSAAGAQLEQVKAGVGGASALVEEAELALADTVLRAPFDGVVVARNVSVGALAAPGTVAFVLADVDTMKAVFGVPDMQVGRMKLGETLRVVTAALPGEVHSGRITRIAPMADPASRVFEVEVSLPNRAGRLRSGFIASLQVGERAQGERVLVVPLSAVVRPRGKTQGYAVLVVERADSGAVARERGVKLGRVLGNEVVAESGVRAGDAVIVKGATLARVGEPVRVVP